MIENISYSKCFSSFALALSGIFVFMGLAAKTFRKIRKCCIVAKGLHIQ